MKMASKIKEVLEATEKYESEKLEYEANHWYCFWHTPRGTKLMDRVRLAEKDLAECILSYNAEA